MASKVPVVKQIAWNSLISQLLLIGALIYVFHLLDVREPFIWGALTYSVLAFTLRNLIAKHHRQGMSLVRQQRYAEAIPYFEKSVDYFTRNSWVDKYRFLTLLSSSKMPYKEMGLCNTAFCYSQIGNGQQAKAYYEKVLVEFPNNGLAIAGLNMLNALSQNTNQQL